MTPTSSLHMATAWLAGLGAVMLAVSEDNYVLAATAIILSLAAWLLCDVTGRLQLKTWSANLASIFALGVAAVRFVTLEEDARLLTVADLMCYLQFILQFREKTVRNLWMLAVVSILQVAVAAALQTGLMFALLLVVYLFVGIFFLLLFYLYREQLSFAQRAAAAEAATARDGAGFSGRRRPEPASPLMRREISRRVIDLGLGTAMLAAVLFAIVPRTGQTRWNPGNFVGAREVGFTPEINLTRSGEITEDPEIVMRVKFTDAVTGLPHQLESEPYFRGTVLNYYLDGRWRAGGYRRGNEQAPPPPSNDLSGLLRQDITIEPLSTTTLFACAPWFSEDVDQRVYALNHSSQLFRPENLREKGFTYSLLTPRLRNPTNQRAADVIPRTSEWGEPSALLRMPEVGGNDPLAQLRATAAEVVADIPPDDVVRRAKALEAHLRDSGRYLYTLYTPKRPPEMDPLEHFVAEDPRGHCEYFAGTLAMMLRSVGIPSRIVVGFYGAEWNVVGNFYVVRQTNAHSWVEALIDKDHVPFDRIGLESQAALARQYGAWLRLDPTTASDAPMTMARQSYWGEAKQVFDYLTFLWNNYVVGMDAATQHESVYQPISAHVRAFYNRLIDPQAWREALARLDEALRPSSGRVSGAEPRGGGWLSWVLIVVAAGGLVWGAFRLRRRLRAGPRTLKRSATRSAGPPVDFYVQLEQILARHKLRRAPEQTQREFVQLACGELAGSPATRAAAALPRRIVDAFYRVRFGGRPLSDDERRDVEQALTALTSVPVRSANGSPTNGRGRH